MTSSQLRLRLYLAGESSNSLAALANLRSALADRLVDLEIIDILKDPERGVRDGVLMTPMLVRVEPFPERRVLGNLRNREILLGVLGLEEALHG